MKVTLIHCYSDFNKGDLGIILGTVNELKRLDSAIEINAISTFEKGDPKFGTDHGLLKGHVDKVYPAVLGRAYSKSGKAGLIFKVLRDLPKLFSIYSGLFKIAPTLFLGKSGARSYEIIRSSDMVISKGGSFICNQPGLINQMRFFRLMSTFWVTFASGVNVSILGQSLGPVYGTFSRNLTNKLLKRCHKVVVRETVCLDSYPYIKKHSNFVLGRDMAFSLNMPKSSSMKQYEGFVGFTIKRFAQKSVDDNYSYTLKMSMEYLIKELGKEIVIIPHVTIDDDMDKSREVFELLDESVKQKVHMLTADYDADELLDLYGQLSLVVGTRLHSTIFSTVASTPAINISYHGTKSRGVFSGLEIHDLVLEGDDINYENLKIKIDYVFSEDFDFQSILTRLETIKKENREITKALLS